MRRLSIILGVFVLALTVNAQSIMLQTGNKGITKSNDAFTGFQATFSYDQIESVTITGTERGTFSMITIEGTLPSGEFGTPQLPVFRKMIQIPVDATPKVVVKNFTTTEYNLNEYGIHKIYPRQPSVRKDQDINDVPFIYDEKAYNRDAFNQSSLAEVNILGTMRGVIIGVVDVNPVQYNPVTQTIMVYNNIEVEVVFENANRKKTEDLYVGTYSPYFKNIYNVLFNDGISRDIYDDHPDLYKTPVHMLVVANQMFEATLQPWLEWKTQKGFYLDVNYIATGTTAAQIKTLCHNKYNEGIGNGKVPTFIVFVGDTPELAASKPGTTSDGNKASDLHYASVDGDYFPEMFYSRLSAQTAQQLANQIEKILYYEKYQFADPTYLDNVLLIAGADGTWAPLAGRPQINYAADHYYNVANGYANVHKYVTSNYTDCYSHLNNVGFANYTAHCSQFGWGDPSYSKSQINSLTNINKYFIAMGNCCLAADFGWINPDNPNDKECFGEAIMRAEKKGAVGYIGSAPLSYWHDDLHFTVGAYFGYFGPGTPASPTFDNTKDGVYDFMFRDADFNSLSSHVFGGNVSVTYAMATTGYTTDMTPLYYWEAYNVLGDGSLMPYNGQAADNTVSHMPVVYIGLPTYEVQAVPGSYVAVSKDGVLLGVAVADASGIANVTLDPPINSGGNVDIVVTRNQYKPYMVQVPAVAQSGPYIVPGGYEGVLTYISVNEEIEVILKNVGIETTNTLTVTLSCDDSQLTITNNTATCPGIAPDESATVTFKVTVANDIPDNKSFSVNVNVTEAGKGGTWDSKMTLKAYAPNFSLEKVLVDGTEGGNLRKGSITTLTTIIKNKGGANAYGIKGNLDIHSPYITLACEEYFRAAGQDLPAGESMDLNFIVITDPEMPTGHEASIDLLISAQYRPVCKESFKVTNSGSDNYCMPGNTNCSGFNDRITSLILVKTSDQSVVYNNSNPLCISGLGYTDYTSIILDLTPGMQYTIKVKTGYQNHRVRGWIDINGNNLFDDSESMFTIVCTSANVEYSANFTIPEDVAPGIQRFRIRTRDGGDVPGACDTYSYGQTLDFSVAFPELPRVKNVEAEQTGNSIVVSWEVPEEGTPNGYNVYRNGEKLNSAPLAETTFTETNLSEGIYAYNVTAVYPSGESYAEMSDVICYFLVCEMPVGLAGTDNEKTAILTWSKLADIGDPFSGYNIYRDGEKLNTQLLTVTEYNDEELANGTYTYQISAVYDLMCFESEWTEGVEVEIKYVGINELETDSYSIYPNPTNGNVTFEGIGLNSIEIYDIQGRTLAQYTNLNGKLQINVNSYENGIYFVRLISSSGEMAVKRLVVIK